MHLEPWQWALAAFGAFLAGVAKTGVPGIGILTAPIFALLLPARESVGIVLMILICSDLMAVATYRRDAQWKTIVRLSPWALAGIALGTLALGRLDDHQVRVLIGAILLPMVALAVRRRHLATRGIEEKVLPAWAAAPVGVTAGFTTMVANAAGPVMVLYLLAMRLPKITFLGTAAWYFFCLNWAKVPFGIYAGAITGATVRQGAVFFPAAIVGGLCGRWLAGRIPQKAFELLALAFTALSATWLLGGEWLLTILRAR